MEEEMNGAVALSGTNRITVEVDSVFESLRREASYIAGKSVTKDDPDAYARISIGDDEQTKNVLLTFWNECGADAVAALRPFLVSLDYYDADLSVDIDDSVKVADIEIQSALGQYMKDMMLYKWLAFASSAMADRYGKLALSALDSIREKLGARRMEGREQKPSDNGDAVNAPSGLTGGADSADDEEDTSLEEVTCDVSTNGDDVRGKPVGLTGGADSADDGQEASLEEVTCDVSTNGDDVREKPVGLTGGADKDNGDAVGVARTWKDAESKRRDMDMQRFGVVEVISES